MITCTIEDAVTDWIIDYPGTQAIFQELGIDHHCGGKSLAYAVLERGLEVHEVLAILLKSIASTCGSTRNY